MILRVLTGWDCLGNRPAPPFEGKEGPTSSSRKGTAAGLLFAAAWLFCATPGAFAQESGTFRAIAPVFHDYTTIEHGGAEVFGGPLQGVAVIVESSGGPWVVDAKGRRTCVVFGRRGAEGLGLEAPCTVTDASGDQWFTISKRNVGDMEEGGGGVGRMELLSGSGRFTGITGSCTYTTEYLVDNWLVTDMTCEWNRQ